MIVVILRTPMDSIRGMLKRWFAEITPNVFVGSVNARTRDKLVSYLRRNAPNINMTIVYDDESIQGYKIQTFGEPYKKIVFKSGLQLLLEHNEF